MICLLVGLAFAAPGTPDDPSNEMTLEEATLRMSLPAPPPVRVPLPDFPQVKPPRAWKPVIKAEKKLKKALKKGQDTTEAEEALYATVTEVESELAEPSTAEEALYRVFAQSALGMDTTEATRVVVEDWPEHEHAGWAWFQLGAAAGDPEALARAAQTPEYRRDASLLLARLRLVDGNIDGAAEALGDLEGPQASRLRLYILAARGQIREAEQQFAGMEAASIDDAVVMGQALYAVALTAGESPEDAVSTWALSESLGDRRVIAAEGAVESLADREADAAAASILDRLRTTFPDHDHAFFWTVDRGTLLHRAGRVEEGRAVMFSVAEMYGPGSSWLKALDAADREVVMTELRDVLHRVAIDQTALAQHLTDELASGEDPEVTDDRVLDAFRNAAQAWISVSEAGGTLTDDDRSAIDYVAEPLADGELKQALEALQD